jgi:hypothetical protein
LFASLFRVLALLGLLALTACTSGMVLGGQASCSGSTLLLTQVTGECTRDIDELSEVADESIAVQTADIAPFATVEYELTVETGRVAITFTDFHGNEQTTEATPGSPATGSVRLQLDPLNRINFKLAPLDGPAADVSYQLNFVCDCMP